MKRFGRLFSIFGIVSGVIIGAMVGVPVGDADAQSSDHERSNASEINEIPEKSLIEGFDVKYADVVVDPSQMRAARPAYWAEAEGQSGLKVLGAPKINAFLNSIIQDCLLPKSPHPNAIIDVRLVAEAVLPESGKRDQIVRAHPSGVILISPMTLKAMEEVKGLVFVLAHELGHVQMQHPMDAWGAAA